MNLLLAISKTCNLRCKYCYVPEYNKNNNKQGLLAEEAVQEIVDKTRVENIKVDNLLLHGAEPTTVGAESLVNIINKISPLINDKITIQTNGTLLTKEYVDKLKGCDRSKIYISISMDGPSFLHNKNRQNNWDLIFNNLLYILVQGYLVSVTCVVTKAHIEHLNELKHWVEYMDRLGCIVQLKPVECFNELNKDEQWKFAQWLIDNKLWKYSQPFNSSLCASRGNKCNYIELDMDGNCYACSKLFDKNGVFDNWKQSSFKNIIQKRKQYFKEYKTNPECADCPYLVTCNSGCPVTRVNFKSVDCEVRRYFLNSIYGKKLPKEIIEGYKKDSNDSF